MTFYSGQKVVAFKETRPGAPIKQGTVYTVCKVCTTHDAEEGVGITLHELDVPQEFGEINCCFAAHGFRPAVDRRTDISVFTKLLDKQPEKVS